MKKIMLLGGNYVQMTATQAAKDLGYHVINVDYLPDNPAHKIADEYYNVSTTDMKGVLELAKKLKIEGIVSYASDVSAPTASYVAEKLGLPGYPYESVKILTRKDLTKPFLEKNHFCSPRGRGFSTYEDALEYFQFLNKPVMVKPVDSSGSKGVGRAEDCENFRKVFDNALQFSRAKTVVVEEFIVQKGYKLTGDCFIVDGKIRFAGFMNGHFDLQGSPFVPTGTSYPSLISPELRIKVLRELNRLISILGLNQGAINLDILVDEHDNIYLLEIGPRNGGNLISDTIKYAVGVDLPYFTMKSAVGENCSELKEPPGSVQYTSSYNIHTQKEGIFRELIILKEIKDDIVKSKLMIGKGEKIFPFTHGGYGIGVMMIRHDSSGEMCYRMDHMEEYLQVVVD